jgi:hypothetical protein
MDDHVLMIMRVSYDNKNWKVDVSYGGSKVTRVLVSKVYINEKINITMETNIKNQCSSGPMWWLIN